MTKLTWAQASDTYPDSIFGTMWDWFEEDTGNQPNWTDIIPDKYLIT